MPDFLTHHLFGQALFPTREVMSLVARREDTPVYLWSQQGPDLLYFRGALTGQPLGPLAGRLHREAPGQFFYTAARHVAAQEGRIREISMAAFGGLLCHYVLDRTLHPYVLARQKDLQKLYPKLGSQALHIQVEADMDTDLHALWRRAPVSQFRPWDDLELDDAQGELLARLWTQVLIDSDKISIDPAEIRQAFRDGLTFQKLLYQGGGGVQLAARGVELFLGGRGTLSGRVKYRRPRWDSLNLGAAPWVDIQGNTRTDTVPQLLAAAQVEARRLIGDYLAMWETGEVRYRIFEETYLGQPG